MAEIILTSKGTRWTQTGHPWVYRDDVKSVDGAAPGQIISVHGNHGRFLGQAFYNGKSKIALRWVTRQSEEPINRTFWKNRLEAALRYREEKVHNSIAYRLISSEADGFPGLIADRYGSVLVLQVLSFGMDLILPEIVELFQELLHPSAIVARNDSPVRSLEGLTPEKKMLYGTVGGPIEITEGTIRYLVDVWEGQKTGAFLDQRDNRIRAGELAHGRVLDAFSYQGAFALHMAARAREVVAVEDSESAVSRLQENVALNGLRNVTVERKNAFDHLRFLDRNNEKFDCVVLDPPAFAKNRGEIHNAVRGYKEINVRALRLISSGGILITCSCSFQIEDGLFWAILQEASADAKRLVRLREIRTQAVDHPIVMTHPESKYLKCLVLEVV